jgi:FKBP-type peptidyl-prolyl cis-trans isomerase
MKKFVVPCLLTALVLAATCEKAPSPENPGATLDADTSYAFGMLMAREFALPGVTFDYQALVEGYKAMLQGETKFSQEEALAKLQPVLVAAMEGQTQELRETEERFLAANGMKPGITVTPSGLQYEALSPGEGKRPGPESTVRVHYEGTLVDGTVFDSSYARGEPAEFFLSGVIPGWVEGIQLMNVGSAFRFYIPSSLGYGPQGMEGGIPPYSTLIFKVELLAILDGEGAD